MMGEVEVGSRFMHLLITDYVRAELHIEQRGRMLLGALAPDATHAKFDTHFNGDRFKHSPGQPWEYGRFILKYRNQISDPFMIGYLTHLVADEVWAMKSYFSGFQERLHNDPTLYERYHEDFRLCNAKLDAVYECRELYDALAKAVEIPQIEEVTETDVLELKEHALADFDYPNEHLQQKLRVFSFDEILAYIERSSHSALDACLPFA